MPPAVPATLLRPPAPFCANVELTSLCNQKCVMCPLTAGNTLSSRQRGHMALPTWERVLTALRVIGQVQWIGYGETLLHPQALEFMRAADGHGVRSSLSTNGTRLNEATCAALAALDHLVHVNVSIDSPDPDIYRAIRKTPIDAVLEGLATLARHVDRRRITVTSVVMAENVESLADLPEMLARFGIAKYQLNVLHEQKGRHFGGELDAASSPAMERIRIEARRRAVELVVDVPARLDMNLADAGGYDSAYRDGPQANQTRRCLLPWEFPFIDKDGRVFLCSNATGREDEVVGSILVQDFMEIWHGERMQDIRRRFLSSAPLPPSCRQCSIQAIGTHPLHEYRAEIVTRRVSVTHAVHGTVQLQARNAGPLAWQKGEISVGTIRPRDRASAFHTGDWLSVNRIARNEARVAPGEVGMFVLPLSAGPRERQELFQLVKDGAHWVAASEFTIVGGV